MINPLGRRPRPAPIVAALLLAAAGLFFLQQSGAATYTRAVEVETGSIAGRAAAVETAGTSAGAAVVFGAQGAGASPVQRCTGTPVNATPATINSVLGAAGTAIVTLSPGTYPPFEPEDKACLELRCSVPAIVNGAPNPNGCKLTRTMNVQRVTHLTIDNLVFTNDNIASGSSADYGAALYEGTEYVRIINSAFKGNMNHDISTKNTVTYIEVLDNLFVGCMRHCFEIGQNGNIPSRPSTGDTAIVRGNIFDAIRGNAMTQRYNRTLIVEDNEFRNVSGYAVYNWPFWDEYDGELNRIPAPPLRTAVTNNTFVGANKLGFVGRGATDDVVLVKGNTGSVPSCRLLPMDGANSGTSAAHSDEQTTAPPTLDTASDIACRRE